MPVALVGGTGIYNLPGIEVEEKLITNQYGPTLV